MKCSVCGNEFGNGANCQSCGVDRVTGLGNYIGYDTPMNASMDIVSPITQHELEQQTEVVAAPQNANVGSMVCYACGEIIPADSKFCPYCSRELYVACPKCGNKYSSQFPACNQCGTNREKYLEEEKKVKEKNEKLKKKSVVIPEGTLSIPPNAYKGYYNLKRVTIPQTVTTIEEGAFDGCYCLDTIVLPNMLKKIGENAFMSTGISTIEIPASVGSIGKDAFSICTKLTTINVAKGNPSYSSIDGVLFNHNKTRLIKMPNNCQICYFIIPNSVTSIDEHAFSFCKNLQSVEIPDSVTKFGNYCFYGCKSLQEVKISETGVKINKTVFEGCDKLSENSRSIIKRRNAFPKKK